MLKEALHYLSLGYSVFPLHFRSKMPAVKWEIYQSEHPNPELVSTWFTIERNLAICTGKISNLVVIDVDVAKGGQCKPIIDRFPTNMIARTGNGFHLFYKHPGWHVDNSVNFLPGVDIRGDGGYVVAAPSIHPNGRKYEWITDLGHLETSL